MLEPRNDLMDSRKASLVKSTTSFIHDVYKDNSADVDAIIKSLYDCGYISISPPMQEPFIMHMMTINSMTHKGETIKLGNLRCNMKKLIASLPDVTTFAVSMVIDMTILKVCAALNLWRAFRNIASIEIDKVMAIIVIALWSNCTTMHTVELEKGFVYVNTLFKQQTGDDLAWDDYIEGIERLQKIGSVKLSDDGIWLCEWVNIQYK